MTRNQKDYCINNLASLVIDKLGRENPGKGNIELTAEFMSSHTYELLADYETRLWAEGPDYIIELYKEETNKMQIY